MLERYCQTSRVSSVEASGTARDLVTRLVPWLQAFWGMAHRDSDQLGVGQAPVCNWADAPSRAQMNAGSRRCTFTPLALRRLHDRAPQSRPIPRLSLAIPAGDPCDPPHLGTHLIEATTCSPLLNAMQQLRTRPNTRRLESRHAKVGLSVGSRLVRSLRRCRGGMQCWSGDYTSPNKRCADEPKICGRAAISGRRSPARPGSQWGGAEQVKDGSQAGQAGPRASQAGRAGTGMLRGQR